MNRIRRRSCGTQPQIGVQINASKIVAKVPTASSYLEARLHGVTLASQDSEIVADAFAAVLGGDLNYSRGAISVLRRKDPIDEAYALHEVCVEQLRKSGIVVDVEGQHDAVHLVLDSRMLTADVNLLILIESYARHLEKDLIERRRFARR